MKNLLLKKVILMLSMLSILAQADTKLEADWKTRFDAAMAKHPEALRKRIKREIEKIYQKNSQSDYGKFFSSIPEDIVMAVEEIAEDEKLEEKSTLRLSYLIENTTEESFDAFVDRLNAENRNLLNELVVRVIKIMGAEAYKKLAENELGVHKKAYDDRMAILAQIEAKLTE